MKLKLLLILTIVTLLLGTTVVVAEEEQIEIERGGWDPHTDQLKVRVNGLEPTVTLDYVGAQVKYHFLFDNGEETLEVNIKKKENRIVKNGKQIKKLVYTIMNTKRNGVKEPASAVKKELHVRITDDKVVQKLVNQDTGKTEVKYKYNRNKATTKVYVDGVKVKTYNGYAALLFKSDNGDMSWYGLE